MFSNYVKTALRAMLKNKLYAAINVFGLALGLSTFIAATIIADYEKSHDVFFTNAERIHVPLIYVSPDAGLGMSQFPAVQSIVAPLLKSESTATDAVARLISREVLVGNGNEKLYQNLRFADPEILEIMQFDYIDGDAQTALSDPSGIVISEEFAEKIFGDQSALGEVLSINNNTDLRVTAIIKNIPKNSHLQTSIITPGGLDAIATLDALNQITGFDTAGDWNNLSGSDTTYLLLKDGYTVADVESELNSLFETHAPDDTKKMFTGLGLRSLQSMNLAIWDITGLPAIISIQILGVLILIIAILNYTNLATAQTMGRMKEVGMRKALGASKKSLFIQFITESMVTAFLGLFIAIAFLEFIIPLINNAANKIISFNYFSDPSLLAWLVGMTVVVGFIAGGYPAYVISKINPSRILSGSQTRGKTGSFLRNSLLVIQFTISIFMMTAVAIIFMQNKKIEESGEIFSKDQIYTINRMSNDDISPKASALKNELNRLPGVTATTFVSQLPFDQSHSSRAFTKESGDEAGKFDLYLLSIDESFSEVFDMPIIAGRNLDKNIANDILKRDEEDEPLQDVVNILVNELTANQLGFDNPAEVIGQRVYTFDADDPNSTEYIIIGLVADNNYIGFFNEVKPFFFINDPSIHRIASIKMRADSISTTVDEIETAWDSVVPNYPIDARFLDDVFDSIFAIFKGINAALAGFAVVAISLALIGLFGMAAFMAEKRTKEIGLRKVMGANLLQITRLLVWQFSRPVFIGLILALPLGYLASTAYLDFFSDRINLSAWLFVFVAIVALGFSWVTVGIHAYRTAKANPINALRYE